MLHDVPAQAVVEWSDAESEADIGGEFPAAEWGYADSGRDDDND